VKSLEFRSGIALTIALLAIGCGDNAGPAADATPGQPARLEVDPVGDDQRGLAPSATTELRVVYSDPETGPIANAPVTFTLVPGTRGAGGATLSASLVATGGDGGAAVTLTAGPERADFRVVAEAAPARVTFYVNVSAGGFATVRIAAAYHGRRDEAELGALELRAYRLPCAAVSPAIDPEDELEVLAPRTVPPDEPAWSDVPAGESYTLLAWHRHATSGQPVTTACTELAPAQVLATDTTVHLALADEPLAIAARAVIGLDLAPLAAALAGADRPWRVLGCASGGGQLVLDWLIDALADDGALDGVIGGPLAGDAAAIAAQRGALADDGCRAATRGGGASLDAALDAILVGASFPSGVARNALALRRAAGWSDAALLSTLEPRAAGVVGHHLDGARFADVTVDLAASARPVLAASAAVTVAADRVVLARHGFTARLGAAAGEAFARTALAPAGLDPTRLGQALFASASVAGRTGCAAIGPLVCAAAGLGDGCATAACVAASAGLDGGLTAWWRAADGAGLDLALAGALPVRDGDGDLVVDPVAGATWTAEITPAAGPTVAVPATVTTELP
jgi:hypothetical protein